MVEDGHHDAPASLVIVIDEFADLVIPHNKTKAEKELSDSLNAVISRIAVKLLVLSSISADAYYEIDTWSANTKPCCGTELDVGLQWSHRADRLGPLGERSK